MVEKRNYLKETVVNNLNEKPQAIDLLYKSSILNFQSTTYTVYEILLDYNTLPF